jgi:hypothetical protein
MSEDSSFAWALILTPPVVGSWFVALNRSLSWGLWLFIIMITLVDAALIRSAWHERPTWLRPIWPVKRKRK